jgi:dTDP-4-dehydrorhamnose reductase
MPATIILGKNGQVGGALAQCMGAEALAYGSSDINLLQPDFTDKLTVVAEKNEIRTLINAAAYTHVDKAESEPDIAMHINGEAVGALAHWCRKHDVTLVHYSTDYVFDGSGTQAHKEEDKVLPLSVYGKSKLRGEELIAASGAEHIIFRTSWVYDIEGINFVNTMRKLFKEREELKIVSDQLGAPTYAPHLARATLEAISHASAAGRFPEGIYHLCGAGETSWYEFAQAIFALACVHESGIKCASILPIKTSEYPTPAKRPLNSRLDCTKAADILGVNMPHWKDGLSEYYESIRLRD